MVHKIPDYTQSAYVFQFGGVLCSVPSFPMPPFTWRKTKKQRQAMTFDSRREGHRSVFRVSSSLPSLPHKIKLQKVCETHVICSSVSFYPSAVICHPPISSPLCWGCAWIILSQTSFYFTHNSYIFFLKFLMVSKHLKLDILKFTSFSLCLKFEEVPPPPRLILLSSVCLGQFASLLNFLSLYLILIPVVILLVQYLEKALQYSTYAMCKQLNLRWLTIFIF